MGPGRALTPAYFRRNGFFSAEERGVWPRATSKRSGRGGDVLRVGGTLGPLGVCRSEDVVGRGSEVIR